MGWHAEERNVTGDTNIGKAVPLQAWSGPEGSRKLRLPDFMTTAQDGGEVSLTHRPLFTPQEIHLVLISVRGWVDPRAIVRSEGFYVNNTRWDRTRDLPICSAAPKPLCHRGPRYEYAIQKYARDLIAQLKGTGRDGKIQIKWASQAIEDRSHGIKCLHLKKTTMCR